MTFVEGFCAGIVFTITDFALMASLQAYPDLAHDDRWGPGRYGIPT